MLKSKKLSPVFFIHFKKKQEIFSKLGTSLGARYNDFNYLVYPGRGWLHNLILRHVNKFNAVSLAFGFKVCKKLYCTNSIFVLKMQNLKTGKKHLNEEITPLLPLGAG
jgi:hypothetical protein